MTKLPYIAIEGIGNTKEEVLDSLITIEPLLVMMGYNKPHEDYNNIFCSDGFLFHNNYLMGNSDNSISYNNHEGIGTPLRFKANEMDKLIKYLKL